MRENEIAVGQDTLEEQRRGGEVHPFVVVDGVAERPSLNQRERSKEPADGGDRQYSPPCSSMRRAWGQRLARRRGRLVHASAQLRCQLYERSGSQPPSNMRASTRPESSESTRPPTLPRAAMT